MRITFHYDNGTTYTARRAVDYKFFSPRFMSVAGGWGAYIGYITSDKWEHIPTDDIYLVEVVDGNVSVFHKNPNRISKVSIKAHRIPLKKEKATTVKGNTSVPEKQGSISGDGSVKYSVGDELFVTGNSNYHKFQIGEKVKIDGGFHHENMFYYHCSNGNARWYVREDELSPVYDNPLADDDDSKSSLTPCQRLGYKVGDRFEVLEGPTFDVGSIVELETDCGDDCPVFKLIEGHTRHSCCSDDSPGACVMLHKVRKIS